MRQNFLCATLCCALLSGGSLAQDVGSAILSEKQVSITIAGAGAQRLRVGGAVQFGGRIETGFDAGNVDEFIDGTRLTVAAGSSVTIDKYVFDPAASSGAMRLSLTKGAMRFISGKIGSDDYEIRTPNAYLGIRGTSFVLSYTPVQGTIVVVEEGVVELSNLAGDGVSVSAGLSASVSDASFAPTPPAPPTPAANAAVTDVNTSVAVSAPAAIGVPGISAQIAGRAADVAATVNETPADDSDSSFGGDGKY